MHTEKYRVEIMGNGSIESLYFECMEDVMAWCLNVTKKAGCKYFLLRHIIDGRYDVLFEIMQYD